MRRTFILVTFFLFGTDSALADTLVLAPSKDDTLIQRTSAANQLSNGQGDIFVGRTNQDGNGPATISIRRGLIAFDLAGNLPAGATIVSATLTLRDVMGLNGDPTVELHQTLQDWGEGGSFFNGGQGIAAQNNDATWYYTFFNADNPGASPTWTTPGGNFLSTVSAAAVITDDLGGGQLFSWTTAGNPQMLADLQSWLDNPSSNFGWTLIGDESRGQSAKRLNSRESTTFPNVPPQLTLSYVVPEPSSIALAAFALFAFTSGMCRNRR